MSGLVGFTGEYRVESEEYLVREKEDILAKNYKRHSGVLRVPLGEYRVEREHRPYLSEDEFERLLDGPVLIEEKLDGTDSILEDLPGYENYIFYCEDLKYKHSIEYNRVPPPFGENVPAFFVCYDIWIIDESRWANREEKEDLCEMRGVPVSPLLQMGEIKPEDIPIIADRKSAFGDERIEGIVIKNYATGVFGKFINSEFHESVENIENWRKGKWVLNRMEP